MTSVHSQESDNKTAVGGIKFSKELVQIGFICEETADSSFEDVLQLLAEKAINIPFLCHSGINRSLESIFCVDCKDFDAVQSALNGSFFADKAFTVTQSVGTLTAFPHRYSFQFLGQVLGVLAHYNYPIYSLSTSISTIAINTDYFSLDKIVEKLLAVIELPENHAPFRQEFCLKQIQQ